MIPDFDAPNNRIDAESFETLKWLDAQDGSGETFRYSMIGKGSGVRPARATQTNINFYDQVNRVHQLAHLLQGGYSAALGTFRDLQEEYLQEMNEEYLQEMSDRF